MCISIFFSLVFGVQGLPYGNNELFGSWLKLIDNDWKSYLIDSPWILACTCLYQNPPDRMAMGPVFWWIITFIMAVVEFFQNRGGGGDLIPASGVTQKWSLNNLEISIFSTTKNISWTRGFQTGGSCIFLYDWLMMMLTIYLQVCSQAQDSSMDSQFSVTVSVQQGLSYWSTFYTWSRQVKEEKYYDCKLACEWWNI